MEFEFDKFQRGFVIFLTKDEEFDLKCLYCHRKLNKHDVLDCYLCETRKRLIHKTCEFAEKQNHARCRPPTQIEHSHFHIVEVRKEK